MAGIVFGAAKVIGAAVVAAATNVPSANAFMVNMSVAGDLVLTLIDGTTITVSPVIAIDNIYPFAVTRMVVSSGTVATAYNLRTAG